MSITRSAYHLLQASYALLMLAILLVGLVADALFGLLW